MSSELQALTWTAVLTAVLWIPYILDRFRVRGLSATVGYPENPRPQAAWARRLQSAHGNAVENLVVFASLVLVAELAERTDHSTALAALVFFWARLVHAVVYALGVPWLRTIAFVVGFVCQMVIAWKILA